LFSAEFQQTARRLRNKKPEFDAPSISVAPIRPTHPKGTLQVKKRQRSREEIEDESRTQRVVAWQAYQTNLRAGMDKATSLADALRKALPRGVQGSTNRNRELDLWKHHQLWPPPEAEPLYHRQTPLDGEPAADRLEETMSLTMGELAQTMWQAGKSSDVIRRETPQEPALSDAEILHRAKEILMKDVFVAERPTTAKGRESTLPTAMVAARFPDDLVAELKSLGGRMSHHLEKALRLYLKFIKTE